MRGRPECNTHPLPTAAPHVGQGTASTSFGFMSPILIATRILGGSSPKLCNWEHFTELRLQSDWGLFSDQPIYPVPCYPFIERPYRKSGLRCPVSAYRKSEVLVRGLVRFMDLSGVWPTLHGMAFDQRGCLCRDYAGERETGVRQKRAEIRFRALATAEH